MNIEELPEDTVRRFAKQIGEQREEIARLRAALQTLWDEVNNVRNDLGTNYPALAEAWQRAASALLWHESR
jgi:uncharacterized coiled-coil protein SlyX